VNRSDGCNLEIRAPSFESTRARLVREAAGLSGGVLFRLAFNFKIVSAREGRGDSVESEPLPIQLPIAGRENERIRGCKTLTGFSVWEEFNCRISPDSTSSRGYADFYADPSRVGACGKNQWPTPIDALSRCRRLYYVNLVQWIRYCGATLQRFPAGAPLGLPDFTNLKQPL
jgi:hypothetical protein